MIPTTPADLLRQASIAQHSAYPRCRRCAHYRAARHPSIHDTEWCIRGWVLRPGCPKFQPLTAEQ